MDRFDEGVVREGLLDLDRALGIEEAVDVGGHRGLSESGPLALPRAECQRYRLARRCTTPGRRWSEIERVSCAGARPRRRAEPSCRVRPPGPRAARGARHRRGRGPPPARRARPSAPVRPARSTLHGRGRHRTVERRPARRVPGPRDGGGGRRPFVELRAGVGRREPHVQGASGVARPARRAAGRGDGRSRRGGRRRGARRPGVVARSRSLRVLARPANRRRAGRGPS